MSKLKNQYSRRAKINEEKFKHLLMLFELDTTSTQMAVACGLNRNTVNRYINLIRERIAHEWESKNPLAKIDCAMLLAHCDKKSSHEKTVLGILEQDNKIYTKILQFTYDWTEKNMVLMKVELANNDTAVYRTQIIHTKSTVHAAFCKYTRHRLKKFRGIRKNALFLHLKECEVRYDHEGKKLYEYLLQIFQNNPL
ncbi:MAG: hypothetical protein M1114_05255 [Candidatus Dependentiae bacterium]|nr:hypothetical protein [Candidatus Dependentiae bacterium]